MQDCVETEWVNGSHFERAEALIAHAWQAVLYPIAEPICAVVRKL